jgi:hypothetical protein
MNRLDPEQMKFWEEAAGAYYKQMTGAGLSYLNGRGINTDSVEIFQLGEVVDPLPGHETMLGRICIPYIKKCGVVALKFRCAQAHDCKAVKCPKYLLDGNQWLYNTAAVDVPSTFLGISEGEMDTIILCQSGIPSVGIPGTEAYSAHPWWPEVLKGHGRIYVFADNDTSNEKNPGWKLASEILRSLPRARKVILPDDMDVTDVYLKFGPEELYRRAGIEWAEITKTTNSISTPTDTSAFTPFTAHAA